MISANRDILAPYYDVRCLSTDEKPVDNIRNGSTLIEIDTGVKYLFDADSKTWVPYVSHSGSSGDIEALRTIVNGHTEQLGEQEDTISNLGQTVSQHERRLLSVENRLDYTYESDGTDAGPIAELTAKGHAEQASTTGKNLLPKIANGSSQGITWTVRDDGTIDVSGTQSGGWNIVFLLNIALQSGTYTLSASELPNNTYVRVIKGSTIIANINEVTSLTFTLSEQTVVTVFAGSVSAASGIIVSGRIVTQLELGSTATSYEPYTGGAPSPSPDYPQEIQVVMGRNLLPPNFENGNIGTNGQNSGTSSSYVRTVGMIKVEPDARYSVTIQHLMEHAVLQVYVLEYTSSGAYVPNSRRGIYSQQQIPTKDIVRAVFPTSSTTGNVRLFVYSNEAINASIFDGFQLELGSTAHPYVPYGYVGMDVYDGDTHVSTTPIPLPSRGWVAGLPDGTADTLTIDEAGKVEWELETNALSIVDASGNIYGGNTGDSGWGGASTCGFYVYPSRFAKNMGISSNAINVYCSHLLPQQPIYNIDEQRIAINAAANVPVASRYVAFRVPRTLLSAYGSTNASESENIAAFLAWGTAENVRTLYRVESVTEECGYIDLPNIPEGATITIPELEGLGVKCFVTINRLFTMLLGLDARVKALEEE